MWTMDELVERVRRALAAEYPGAPNGRVRDVPDRRAIRWYTTIGLVDRPSGMRGRTALYGPRHLMQLVALKRRQAQGHSLAAIQAELAGAGDADLATAARVPPDLLDGAAALSPAELLPAELLPAARAPELLAGLAEPASTEPASTEPAPAAPASTEPARPRFWTTPPAAAPVREVGGVDLGGGAILVLPVRPEPADHRDIAAAARPLLDLLAARGLLDSARTDDGSPS